MKEFMETLLTIKDNLHGHNAKYIKNNKYIKTGDEKL